tara:strand:+ start:5493 stop:6302 length:810 start_codon:yes stop_codon:yes gene_type:complete
MKYIFKVDKIVNYLKPFRDNLPKLYTWKAKIEKLVDLGVLESNEIESINQLDSYDREIILKDRVNFKLHHSYKNNRENFDQLCLWIIKDWGGILTAKDKDTIELISKFLNSDKPSYKRIASASKVGAYMYPDKYIIYDSRVAYSLNWIILSENAGDVYFPIPSGRNSKMVAFDMNVLIRMKNVSHYTPNDIFEMDKKQYIKSKDRELYIPEKDSYVELNNLIKEINFKLWGSDKADKLFYTEMLLFSIADREIFKDITEKIGLTLINNK